MGLAAEQMEFLALEKNIVKASRLDLPVILTKKLHASTTVAATMICARMAGIEVFVTGVHRRCASRPAEHSFVFPRICRS